MQVGSGSFFHFDFQDPDPAKDWPDPQPFYVTVRYQEAKAESSTRARRSSETIGRSWYHIGTVIYP